MCAGGGLMLKVWRRKAEKLFVLLSFMRPKSDRAVISCYHLPFPNNNTEKNSQKVYIAILTY